MANKNRFLTKSRFKIGAECPSKLFYQDNPLYGNKKTDDAFLKALAEGGFQVGELAKIYHPGGIEITERKHEACAAETAALLANAKVTIFEGGLLWQGLFVRVDVLLQTDAGVQLIEVKAKSCDSSEEKQFFKKRPEKNGKRGLLSDWEPYLLDVAYQTYVAQKCMPGKTITPYLMLADKSKKASVDGLNQCFLLDPSKREAKSVIVAKGTTKESVGTQILCKVNVEDEVNFILNEKYGDFAGFEAYVAEFSKLLDSSVRATPVLSKECKGCEFRVDLKKFPEGSKSGFIECWSEATGLSPDVLAQPLVIDIWNFKKSTDLLASRRYLMKEVIEADIGPNDGGKMGLSMTQRQWLQVTKVKRQDTLPHYDLSGLEAEMKHWRFPLHFIDFETTMMAIPFHKGRRPYEQVAFQFSHHKVHEDGNIEHASQYIQTKRGAFPNFDFVRALRESLSRDNGTIFRYSHHENTVLCQIADQLRASASEVADAEELIRWIRTIAKPGQKATEKWETQRPMVDLCELVKMYYYNPATGGSNSIKKVLPAILAESDYLRNKYAMPIYGSERMPSLNYSSHIWLRLSEGGEVQDPYKFLDPIFTEEELAIIEPLVNGEEIADGGAAMMAYAKMQFTEMSELEAAKIQKALLKYCELDTLAMVMIYEHWREKVKDELRVSA